MRLWYDQHGKSWAVAFCVDAALRVRDFFGLDLVEDFASNLDDVLADPVATANVLYAICYEAIEEAGLSQEEFLTQCFDDASLMRAREVIDREVTDFFPQSLAQSRQVMASAVQNTVGT